MNLTWPQPDKYRRPACGASENLRPPSLHGPTQILIALVLMILLVPPLGCSPAAPAPVAGSQKTDVGGGCIVDVPPDWQVVPQSVASMGFIARGGSEIELGFAPVGSKPTQMPYAIVERGGYRGMINPSPAQQQTMADQVASLFETAVNPPSRADRPPLWKRAKVSPVSVDPLTSRFHFTATVTYDMIGDVHIIVNGVFAAGEMTMMTLWTDDDYYAANSAKLTAFGNSLRLGTAPSRIMTFRARMLRLAQIIGAVIVVAVVLLQVVILLRERRERQREDARLSGDE